MTGFTVLTALQGGDVGAGDAAVYEEVGCRDERRVVAGEERYRGSDLARFGEAPHRDVDQPPGRPLRVLGEKFLQQRGVDWSGGERVHPDSLAGELHAELAAHG